MARTLEYRRILVPISGNAESEQAMDIACRLAASRGGAIVAISVVEVPPVLPFDAHMDEEERKAHQLLERAGAVADSYGVGVSPRLTRAREAAGAILEEAAKAESELIVVGAPRKSRSRKGPWIFGSTVEHVLKRAPCRVMLIGTAPIAVYQVHAA